MRIHRAWLVAAVTFLTLICAAAFRSTTSILFMPLEMEFGWSRSLTSTALAVNLVVYGVTAPFAATLMERFSPRRVAVAALGLVALGTGLTAIMTEPWQLILYWGVFVGIGTGCLALVFASLVANRWFSQRRGLVTGVFSAAYATGQLIFLPALSSVVMVDGWRVASIVVALFSAAVIPLFLIFFKNSPSEVGIEPYGGPHPASGGGAAPKNAKETLSVLFKASRKPAF
ncbi:MAG: MFS transporter, partial [Actinobacteria bacterium]|nr:MFS transporter [Actinomycetota bacterium]